MEFDVLNNTVENDGSGLKIEYFAVLCVSDLRMKP